MDTSDHNSMTTLFQQLGLASSNSDIDKFIASHTLSANETIVNAPYWSQSQSSFLKEALEDDSDWTEVVEHLDALLRK